MPSQVILAFTAATLWFFQGEATQAQFPKTPDEASRQAEARLKLAEEKEKQSTKAGLSAIDESKILRALSDAYREIDNLLKEREAFAKSLADLPARRRQAEQQFAAESALSRTPASAPATVTDALLSELQSTIEADRANLYEIESMLAVEERISQGGVYAQRERLREETDALDRARRALATGSTAFGPGAMQLENERIDLRNALVRETLLLLDQREAAAPQFIAVLRIEREVRKLVLSRRGREFDAAFAIFRSEAAREAQLASEAARAARSAVAAMQTPWQRAIGQLDLAIEEARAGAAEDRYKSLDASIDRTLAGQLAEERARLRTLKSQFEAEVATGTDGWSESYRAIRELLESKNIKDVRDGLPALRKVAAKARAAAGDARRQSREIDARTPDDRERALEELRAAAARGAVGPGAEAAFLEEFDRKVILLNEAVSLRARSASRLADVASARIMTIQRLLDTLGEEEQLVRSRGLFVRVESQIGLDSIRTAAGDAVAAVRSAPRLLRDMGAHATQFITDGANLGTILGGSGILLVAAALLFMTKRAVTRMSARLTVREKLTIVERAERLGVGIVRRMAFTIFVAIAVVVGIRLAGGVPALVRAVDASAIVIVFVRLALAVAAALLRPDDARMRLLPVSDSTAKYVWRVALLASMSVFAVAVPRQVLEAIGYGEHNPGFIEILARAQQGLVTLTAILLFLRKSVFENLLPKSDNHTYEILRGVLLRLRAIALTFTGALFVARLAGFQFLAVFLESIALGGALILLVAALARGAVIELWSELLKRVRFGDPGNPLAQERAQFLDGVAKTLISAGFAIGSYLAFVALLRVGASELKAVDVGLVGGRRFNVSDVANLILLIAATVAASRWTRRGVELFAVGGLRKDVGTRYAVAVTSSYLVLILGFFASLSAIGFELRDFAIVLGAAGFGIGLGMQETAANFLCGLILLFKRPVKVGDEIESEGRTGVIVDITITTTRVLTAENYEILIPNREIAGRRLVNHTGRDPHVRGAVRIDAPYGCDPARVRDVLLRTAAAHPSVLKKPAPLVALLDCAGTALTFEVRFWTPVALRIEVESDLRFSLLAALDREGIVLPLPGQEIRVKGPVQVATAP